MRSYLLHIIFMFFTIVCTAQIEAGLLLGLTKATTVEMNTISGMEEGQVLYNTDTNSIHFFNGTNWVDQTNGSDNLPKTYTGTFRITATGNITVTGIPFEPSSVTFTAYANVEDFDMDTDNGTRNNESGLPNAYGNMKGFARNDSGSITEQVIYNGGSGNSINDISRYASSSHSIGLRYSNQNGDKLGLTTATLTRFNTNGFTLNTDNFSDGIVVIFEAYR
ncbi:hypothetical protein [Maribacter sp. 2210JD10-5]|uniref:hypothetical protein n=1 Tax=Maribacter sp. 2210JD10-5 TaxID=3386272 RepID=UPI0039BD7071